MTWRTDCPPPQKNQIKSEKSLKNQELRDIMCRYSKNDCCCKLMSSSAPSDLLQQQDEMQRSFSAH